MNRADVLGCLQRVILTNAKNWKASTHLTPYTPIIKPSGSGKTRLVLELGRHRMLVIYVCLRGEGESGDPARSKITADLEGFKTLQSYNEWIVACLMRLNAFLRSSAENPASQDMSNIYREWLEPQL